MPIIIVLSVFSCLLSLAIESDKHSFVLGSTRTTKMSSLVLALWCCLLLVSSESSSTSRAQEEHVYNVKRKLNLQSTIVEHFRHAYDSYMAHAFPHDELKPLSCTGSNHFGGYSLTVIDALDTLATVGMRSEFWRQVHHIKTAVHFNASMHVSVFETTIRVVGGLLSGHAVALKMQQQAKAALAARNASSSLPASSRWMTEAVAYDGALLRKTVDIADRLIAAFDTPTGLPFNEIHLCDGVDRSKGHATCPAAAGTLLLEFGTLAAWTGNCTYLTVAKRALDAVWKHRGRNNLVGTMIDILSGVWLNGEAHIGASIDSFYEYLVKSYILFGESSYYDMWVAAQRAIQKYTFHDGWFLSSSVDAHRGGVVGEIDDFKFNSLQAFWPGLLVLSGDVSGALQAYEKMHCIVRDWGIMPEYVHLGTYIRHQPPRRLGPGYPLRPEFLESTLFLYEATRDDHFLAVGERFLETLGKTRQRCGFAAVVDVHHMTFEDKMDSYLLAETFKYLYLLFQPTKSEIFTERQRYRQQHGSKSTLPFELRFHLEISDAVLFPDVSMVYNTEAHPIPLSLDTQRIVAKCAAHEDIFFLSHNDLRKISSSFRVFEASEYESLTCESTTTPPPRSSAEQSSHNEVRLTCPALDYMLDVAPVIRRMFYSNGDSCYHMIHAKTLGHPLHTLHRTVLQPVHVHHHAATMNSILQQQKQHLNEAATSAQHVVLEVALTLPRDAQVAWSKDLSVVVTMTVLGNQPESRVHTARGVLLITHFAPMLESLYMPQYNVVVVPGAATLANSAQRARSMASSAEFNSPLVCDRSHAHAPADDISDTKWLWDDVPLIRVQGDGCPATTPHDPANSRQHDLSRSTSLNGIIKARQQLRSGSASKAEQVEQPAGHDVFGVVVARGGCTFRAKVRVAEALGAAFVLITNHDDHVVLMADALDDGSPPLVKESSKIPAFMITQQDFNEQFVLGSSVVTSPQEPQWVTALRSSAWADNSAFLRNASFLCALSARSQLKAFGVDVRVDAEDSSTLLLTRERLAPIASLLREEEVLVRRILLKQLSEMPPLPSVDMRPPSHLRIGVCAVPRAADNVLASSHCPSGSSIACGRIAVNSNILVTRQHNYIRREAKTFDGESLYLVVDWGSADSLDPVQAAPQQYTALMNSEAEVATRLVWIAADLQKTLASGKADAEPSNGDDSSTCWIRTQLGADGLLCIQQRYSTAVVEVRWLRLRHLSLDPQQQAKVSLQWRERYLYHTQRMALWLHEQAAQHESSPSDAKAAVAGGAMVAFFHAQATESHNGDKTGDFVEVSVFANALAYEKMRNQDRWWEESFSQLRIHEELRMLYVDVSRTVVDLL